MNKPLLLAHNFYLAYGQNFERDFNECISSGLVASNDHLFLMARPTELQPKYLNGTPRKAWLVLMAVGDIRELVMHMPYPLPFVAFYRRKGHAGIRVLPTNSFMKRVLKVEENLWED